MRRLLAHAVKHVTKKRLRRTCAVRCSKAGTSACACTPCSAAIRPCVSHRASTTPRNEGRQALALTSRCCTAALYRRQRQAPASGASAVTSAEAEVTASTSGIKGCRYGLSVRRVLQPLDREATRADLMQPRDSVASRNSAHQRRHEASAVKRWDYYNGEWGLRQAQVIHKASTRYSHSHPH